jgi:hypothetical protein
MKHPASIFLIASGLIASSVFAQYEDLSNLAGSSSNSSAAKQVCTLQNVRTTKTVDDKGVNTNSVAFTFSGKPSVYFNYYDAQKKAVVFDFYDAHIGKNLLSTVTEAPITGSTVDSTQIDLNKDTKGLQPDIRDVVRVTMFTPYDLEYEVQDNSTVVTMNFKWSGKKESQLKSAKNAFYWEFPVGLAVVGGVGFGAYELFLKKDDTPANGSPFDSPPAARPSSP